MTTSAPFKTQVITSAHRGNWPIVLAGLCGLCLGLSLAGVAARILMPSLMITVKPSRLGFEETVKAVESAVQRAGWHSSGTTDLQKTLVEQGRAFPHRVKIIKLCKADYAASVLQTDRHVACLMPCTIAVLEDDSGRVFLSKMNTGLMGKLFGGNIARVMGGLVARDERVMLQDLVAQ
jgi:uncharacterized protein (DUF302 family)